jgi:hypothetical protein
MILSVVLHTSEAVGQSRSISGDSYFGCVTRDARDKIVHYSIDGDKEAFKTALGAALLTGACTFFKSGEKVFVTDTAIFSGLVKIRRKGQTAEYWTNLEAVH